MLFDLGIYGLTSIATLFGPAVRMTASLSRQFETRVMDDGASVRPDVEDSALIGLLLADGIAASLNANWNGCLSHHRTRMRALVIGRAGMLHFGVADGLMYLHRPDGAYQALPEGTDASFDGLACRRFTPDGLGAAGSIVGEFAARIVAGDTSTRSLDAQAHVLEIITSAYGLGDAGGSAVISTRF